MTKKTNGSGHKDDDEKLIKFPTLAERDRIRKERERAEKTQKARRPVPFLNISKIPPFSGWLILVFLVIHIVLHYFIAPVTLYTIYQTYGFRPASFWSIGALGWPVLLSPITHLFIHGSWGHFFFNAISALVMAGFFEREFGVRTTAVFFFACGLIGAAIYFILDPFSVTPIIGASGAITGLFGAVIILMFQRGPARISKYGPWPLVAFWVLFMFAMGMVGGGDLAWQAHIGGFLGGIALLHMMQKEKIKF
jgi:membrane associated rhomboid family serine protease